MSRHIIQRQVLELRLPDSLPARSVGSEVEFLLTHEVWPKLDAICSRLEVSGHMTQIERLEIDLPALLYTELGARWSREVCQRFEANLRARMAAFSPTPDSSDARGVAGRPNEASGEVATLASQASRLDVLVFFLEHGTLPWWWDRNEVNLRDLIVELITQARPALRRVLRTSLSAIVPCARLSNQFGSGTVRAVLELLVTSRTGSAAVAAMHEQAVHRFPSPGGSQSQPAALIALESRLLAAACHLADRLDFDESDVVEELLVHVAPSDSELLKFLAEADLGANANGRLRTKSAHAETASPNRGQQPAGSSESSWPPSVPPNEADLTTEVAGLVLLCPYLERFFGHLELLNGNAFRDPSARWRALHLLHFLAVGEEGAPEHALALPKVLCAAPLPEPVPFSVELTEPEKAEAAQLLGAVIKNWPPLKNTSIAGFRQAFLQREGRLALPEDATPMPGWKLRVERQGHDILLDQLPWGLHLVKLPWMPQPLYVEW